MGRGYIRDYMNDTLDSSNTARETQYIQGNHALDLIGDLHCDVFINQDKFLINGVEVRMRLVRSKDSF